MMRSCLRIGGVLLVLAAAAIASAQSTQKPNWPVVVTADIPDPLGLRETRWALASANIGVPTPSDTSRVTLAFMAVDVQMASGCNRARTSYSIDLGTHKLGISTYILTRVACPEPFMTWEPAFFQFLGRHPVASVDGNVLALKSGAYDMRFRRVLE
jgi:heat shock protein HslJ